MAVTQTEAELAFLLDQAHASLKGALIYIAAKEAGVELDPDTEEGKSILKRYGLSEAERFSLKVAKGPFPMAVPQQGFMEAVTVYSIKQMIRELQDGGEAI